VANPLSRRLLWLAGLLSLLLIAVVVNYLVHGGSEVVNPIAAAAQRTAKMPGARLKLEITYSSEVSSKTISGIGTGVYDGRTGRSDIQMTMTLPEGKSVWTESVGDERNIYTRSSTFESLLPPGKLWLGMQPLLGHNPEDQIGSGTGTQGILDQLKAVGGDVEEVDHQTVGGHPTTRYKTSIDPSHEAKVAEDAGAPALAREYEAIAAQLPEPIEVEVWIDGKGLARLISVTQKLPITPDGKTLDITTRMEFFAFGHKSDIPLPPKHKVFDYTPILRAELGLEDGTSFGPLAPPAGTKPLTATAFRHQANAICGRAFGKARELLPPVRSLLERLKGLGPHDPATDMPLLRRLSHWLEGPTLSLWRREFRELRALAPPAEDAATFRRFLLLEAKTTEWSLAGARAYQIGLTKMPNSQGQADRHKQQDEEVKRLGTELGIPKCTEKLDAANSSAELS
jgi:hypothetical protein